VDRVDHGPPQIPENIQFEHYSKKKQSPREMDVTPSDEARGWKVLQKLN
jgi:hypothetical protein